MELNFNLIPDNERILSIFDEIRYLIIVKEGRGFWREIPDRSVESKPTVWPLFRDAMVNWSLES